MTPIEDLVREALATTPVPTTTDPLGSLERRVRRARRWLAAGAGAVTAAVVAAVVVPLAVLGGTDAGKVDVINTPTPSSTHATQPGVTQLRSSGAISLSAAPGEQPWLLYRDSADPASGSFLAFVGPDGSVTHDIPISAPADAVVAGAHTVWVVGTDPASAAGTVTAVDPFDNTTRSRTLEGEVLGEAAVIGDSLYVLANDDAGTTVRRFDMSNDGVDQSGEALPIPQATEIVATTDGHLWVHAHDSFVELIPTRSGINHVATERWAGPLLAPSSNGAVWTTDDPERAVEVDPTSLEAGASVALMGKRLMTHGRPTALGVDSRGGVYVAISGGGIDYFAPHNAFGPVTDQLQRVNVEAMVGDAHGGVDYVDDQGALNHWDPAATAR